MTIVTDSASMTRWVDFHCHLDLYPTHRDLVAQCDAHGIATVAVTTTPKAWPRNREIAADSKHVRVALGLHPQLVAERAHEIEIFERYLPESRYIGEVGLDGAPSYFRSLPQQREVFRHILRLCAAGTGKILTIHSVRAVKDVLDLVEEHFADGSGKAVLHWFTGTDAQARRAVELGCYFSVNARMLNKPIQRALIQSLPLERLLTETDGPFVKHGVRPVEPRDVVETVRGLGRLLSLGEEETAHLMLRNLRDLVRDGKKA